MSDIDSPAAGSERFDWLALRAALLWGGGEICRLRLRFYLSVISSGTSAQSYYTMMALWCKYI